MQSIRQISRGRLCLLTGAVLLAGALGIVPWRLTVKGQPAPQENQPTQEPAASPISSPREEGLPAEHVATILRHQDGTLAVWHQPTQGLLALLNGQNSETGGTAVKDDKALSQQRALLEEEIKRVEQQVTWADRARLNGKATMEDLIRKRRDLLALKRELASLDDKKSELRELFGQEMNLIEQLLNEMRTRVQVGAAAPGDEIPLKRELLALKRQLAALDETQAQRERKSTASKRALADEFDAARARQEAAQAEVKRFEDLSKRGLVTQAQLDQATINLKSAQAALARAEANLADEKPENSRSTLSTKDPRGKPMLTAAIRVVHISSPKPGVIKRILVKSGTRVMKGDPLIQLDDREAMVKLNQAMAQLDVAKAALKVQELDAQEVTIDYDRRKKLVETGLLGQSELKSKEAAVARIEKARAEVKVAESQVEQAKLELVMLTICAPKDGTVFDVTDLQEGKYVTPSSKEPLIGIGD